MYYTDWHPMLDLCTGPFITKFFCCRPLLLSLPPVMLIFSKFLTVAVVPVDQREINTRLRKTSVESISRGVWKVGRNLRTNMLFDSVSGQLNDGSNNWQNTASLFVMILGHICLHNIVRHPGASLGSGESGAAAPGSKVNTYFKWRIWFATFNSF